MSEDDDIFNGIREGLEDAIAFARGDKTRGRIAHVPDEVDVKAIRQQTGLTQEQFARVFGVTIDTLRQWEQGRRKPRGPSRVLLTVIHRAPSRTTTRGRGRPRGARRHSAIRVSRASRHDPIAPTTPLGAPRSTRSRPGAPPRDHREPDAVRRALDAA